MIIVVTGTGTGVGKSIVSAALCSVAHRSGARVGYLKAAQTGVPGDEPDIDVVRRLAGDAVTVVELARYPDPMSPEAAARASGLSEIRLPDVVAAARALAAAHDVVVVEGAGGLLVRYAADGWTIASLAADLDAPLVVVAGTQLGTLNALALTLEAIAHRALAVAGVVIGSWPSSPTALDLSNERDLGALASETERPLGGGPERMLAGETRPGISAKLPASVGFLDSVGFADAMADADDDLRALLDVCGRRVGE